MLCFQKIREGSGKAKLDEENNKFFYSLLAKFGFFFSNLMKLEREKFMEINIKIETWIDLAIKHRELQKYDRY